jgi:excisionase family DNA binding protein
MAREPLLTARELAALLHIDEHHIYNLVYQRRIPFIKIGRALRFDYEQVMRSTHVVRCLAGNGTMEPAAGGRGRS